MIEGIAIVFFIFIWILICYIAYCKTKELGMSVCIASIIWLLFLFFTTESLGAINNITSTTISLCWIFLGVGAITYLIICRRRFSKCIDHPAGCIGTELETFIQDKVCVVILGIVLIMMLRSTYLALNTVPYNWDSMTYHLSRILYWAKHKSVSYYGTNIERQLVSPVLAEYVNLHVFLLTGSDRLFNLLQNISAYGVIFFVYEIVIELEGNRRWACVGCLLVASMNAFYAESTTTQNDVFAAFLLMTFVYQVINLSRTEHINLNTKTIARFISIGANAGLIYITKGNAVIPAAFIAIIFVGIRVVRHDKIKHLFCLGMITCFVAVIIAFPSFYRNYKYCEDIFASEYIGNIAVGTIAPKELMVNIAKNYSNAAVGERNAELLKDRVNQIAQFLDTDINKDTISFGNLEYNIGYSTHIDSASAQIVSPLLWVGLISSLLTALLQRKRKIIAVSLLLQLLVCFATVRWQPWVTRLMIPSLCLAVPGIVYYIGVLFSLLPKKLAKVSALSSLTEFLLLSVLLYQCVVCNYNEYSGLIPYMASENQISPFESYFMSRGNGDIYQEMCETIEDGGYSLVGLYTSPDSYQYPIQARWYGEKNVENVVMTIGTEKENDALMNPEFVPDAIIVADVAMDKDIEYICNENMYSCIYDAGDLYSVWAKSP